VKSLTLVRSVGVIDTALVWDHIYLIFKCFLCFSKTVKPQHLLESLDDLVVNNANNDDEMLQTWMEQK